MTKTPNQGEGDYISARKFNDEETTFAKSGKVARAASAAAAALDGPEGPDLEKARRSTAKGRSGKKA